jgi:hypothetical protein
MPISIASVLSNHRKGRDMDSKNMDREISFADLILKDSICMIAPNEQGLQQFPKTRSIVCTDRWHTILQRPSNPAGGHRLE